MTPLTPDEAIAWSQDIFRQFALTWEVLEQLPNDPALRLRGRTGAGILDLTLHQDRMVRRVTIVVPVRPEYTALVVYTLATLAQVTHSQADAFVAQVLRSLALARLPGKRTVRWGNWQAEVSTAVIVGNAFLTVVITPGVQ